MELDVTISCFTLQGRGQTPQVWMRMKGREGHVTPVCVFLTTVSGSWEGRGTGTPRLSKH